MQALSLPAIIHLITMPVYLGAGITALVRQSVRQRAKNWLAAYLLVAALSATLQMASASIHTIHVWLTKQLMEARWQWYGMLTT